MKIKVKFINGNDIFYDSSETDILSLKNLIANDRDTSVDNIKLIYRGKILKNEESLEQHKIDENSTLHCVVKKSNLNSTNTNLSNSNNNSTNTTPSNLNSNSIDTTSNLNNTILNAFSSTSNLNNLFPNLNLSDINNTNLQDPNLINQINTMYQIPQFRELIISNTLNRMNLPIDSPYRHVIETHISTLLQNPQMTNQIINNFNNLNQNINTPLDQNLQVNNTNDDNSITDNNEINFNELKEKYTSQLEEIKNMGFDDEELILKTLDQSHGSVVISINKLLN
jgi:ubiquilin